ncbi:DUF167 family protein [Enterovirga aerilata]|uniref:UPF0235 protein HJG44_16910 n=1 Tax=Enterovirga aerilata TaxID=2730920 RepID=A0A849IDJ8_9HYPH|nr:DUF167 family protein [Enterovirga sp. DB1703]NNM74057.1 hypothetical protein [Enterovirga sp. DB1703]
MAPRPWREAPGGVLLTVRVTPKGGRDAVDGPDVLANGRAVLRIRVRSAPEGGAANEAARRLIAGMVGRPVSAVRLEAGATARIKTLAIAGDAAATAAALGRATAA